MSEPRILVFAGSIRTGSFSAQLAGLALKELVRLDVEASLISLADYPMPLFDADHEAKSGVPAAARKLHDMMLAHRGIYIATPEYNASLPPLLKNTHRLGLAHPRSRKVRSSTPCSRWAPPRTAKAAVIAR